MKTLPLASAALAGAALFFPQARAQTSLGTQLPASGAVIYLPALPTPADLSNFAASKGLPIESIQVVNGEERVAYRRPTGETNAVT